MSITDELREWLKDRIFMGNGYAELTAIADRIDAEHESKVSYWQDASYKDGYDEGFASADDYFTDKRETLKEHGWVKLPVDADGVPIHVGDKVTEHEDGHTFKVDGFMDWDGEWWVFMRDGIQAPASRCTHYHEPTVEDVLEGFARAYDDIGGRPDEDELWRKILAEYAAKLRLAEREDS